MPYLWANRDVIQSYLDGEGNIKIKVPRSRLIGEFERCEHEDDCDSGYYVFPSSSNQPFAIGVSASDSVLDKIISSIGVNTSFLIGTKKYTIKSLGRNLDDEVIIFRFTGTWEGVFDTLTFDTIEPIYHTSGEAPTEENFEDVAAQRFENEAVYEIATLLTLAFEPDTQYAEYPDSVSEEDRATAIDVGVYSDTPFGFKLPVSEDSVSVSGTKCPNYFCLLAARLAASKIAEVRLGASFSTLPNWVRSYKNESYAQLQRLLLNAQTVGVKGLSLRSDFDVANVLIKMKTREYSGVVDVEN